MRFWVIRFDPVKKKEMQKKKEYFYFRKVIKFSISVVLTL